MTAWQDQPPQEQQPQSRRQLRLNAQRAGAQEATEVAPAQQGAEFGAAAAAASGSQPEATHDGRHGLRTQELRTQELVDTQDPRLEIDAAPTPPFEPFARPAWEAPARRSDAQSAPSATHQAATQQPRSRAEAAIVSGRRSQHSFQQTAPDVLGTPVHNDPAHNHPAQDTAAPGTSAPRATDTQPGAQPPATDITAPEAPAPEDRPVYRIRDFRPESRRSAFSSTSELAPSDWNRPGAAGEPGTLDYYTQQRPGADPDTGPSDVETAERVQSEDRAQPETHTEAEDRAEDSVPSRDEASFPALITPPPAATGPSAPVPPASVSSVSVPPASVPPAVAPAATDAVEQEAVRSQPEEHRLTRRELRALRESGTAATASELAAPEASAPEASRPGESQAHVSQGDVSQGETAESHLSRTEDSRAEVRAAEAGEQVRQFPPPLQAPATPTPQSSHELSNALAEFDALMGSAESSTSDGNEPAPRRTEADASASTAPELSASWSLPPQQSAVGQDDVADSPALGSPPADTLAVEEPVVEAAKPAVEATAGTTADDASSDASRPFTVPTGHWSMQAAADDETDGVTLSRNIGVTSGSVTANHLVISAVPNAKDLLLPFSPTGEIMVTGTIDLPRSFGTTGAHPARYDHSDVDALLEAGDREDSDVDSAPVRAIRAVSTHTSSRGLIGTGKPPRSSRLPMVLAVSTAALATVVVVLFVAGFALHLF